MATGAMVLPEGSEYTVRKEPPTLEPGEVPSTLSNASEFTRAMYATRRRRGRRLPVITFGAPITLKEMAEALYRLSKSGMRLSDLKRQKRRERLEAEIRADLEYGR